MQSVIHLSKYYRNALANNANCINYVLLKRQLCGRKVVQRVTALLSHIPEIKWYIIDIKWKHVTRNYVYLTMHVCYVCMSCRPVSVEPAYHNIKCFKISHIQDIYLSYMAWHIHMYDNVWHTYVYIWSGQSVICIRHDMLYMNMYLPSIDWIIYLV